MSGTVWTISYVLLWVLALVLGFAVVALLRQVGVLHARLRPQGVHFAGEGPTRLQPAPLPEMFDYSSSRMTLVAFTSRDCSICQALMPGIRTLERQYRDVKVSVIDHGPDTKQIFAAFGVRSSPYFVTVDDAGIVKARGVANTLEQVEVMIEESLLPEEPGSRVS